MGCHKESVLFGRYSSLPTGFVRGLAGCGARDPCQYGILCFFSQVLLGPYGFTRNKMAIEKCYPKTPADILYDTLSLLQRWSLLLKAIDKEKVDQAKSMLLRWMRNFESSLVMPTNVVEIGVFADLVFAYLCYRFSLFPVCLRHWYPQPLYSNLVLS